MNWHRKLLREGFMKYLAKTAAIAASSLLFIGAAQASTFELDFNTDFSDPTDPDSAAPSGSDWLTAVFDDGGTDGSATLTLTTGDIGAADVTSVYLNFNDALGIDNLEISQSGGSTATDILPSENAHQADADGIYDLKIDWANNDFMANQVITFNITGSGAASTFVANDFNFLAEVGDENGPFYGAAKFQSTGDGEQSAWVGAVPVPASAWLFSSALGLLGWVRSRPNPTT
jgi:hypothetical protein